MEEATACWLDRLAHVSDRIQRCHVWIDLPHLQRRRGALFQVTIELAIPGAELTVVQDGDDVHVVLASAFLAARRQLQDHVATHRGDATQHAA